MSRTVILLLLILSVQCALSWRYETRCTKITDPSKSEAKQPGSRSSPIIDDLELESTTDMNSDDDYTSPPSWPSSNHLTLRCPNTNDFLFIGLTQYGVVTANRTTTTPQCESSTSDCLVTVDYLANECNGLNSCLIQLDAQFLHSCKRHSDYLSLAYECIPGAQRVDVCSSDETFLIDSTLNANKATPSSSSSLSRFGAFYLTSPGYPNEYADNLKSCSCRLEYVKIESSPSSLVSTPLNTKQSGEISLALSAYEFDLEEGTDENVCNKDYFTIETEAKNETLCGNYKQFRELYAHGQQVSLNFHSDDFITRRGFLFKISTIARTQCPVNASARFDSTRCVSLHSQRLVSWSEASRSCVARGGRLLAINDFVDAMRMSSSIKTDEQSNSAQYWVASSKSKSRPAKCASKSVNGWHDEKSCSSKRPYICEYDAVKSAAPTTSVNRGMSDTNGNRLIRVTCGQASTLFAASNSIVEKSTLSTTTLPTKSIASNSIKNTQRPEDKPQIQASSTVSALIVDYDDEYDQENAAATSSTTNKITTSANEQKSSSNESQTKSRFGLNFISQDYLIIIAVVCGFAIVLIAINIFCIWNYYNKKLNGHFHRGDFAIIPETHHSFRQSSTLLSKSGKNTNNRNTSTSSSSTSSSNGVSGVTNRTLSSCLGVVSNAGGTYIRVPVYDLSNPRESTDSGISGASFKQLTPAECLRMLLNNNGEENSEVANHYYETLSKRQQQQQVVNLNEYHVYNPLETDKFIMPTLLVPQQHQQQSTMVLLTTTNPTSGYPTSVAVPTHKASQYSSMIYGDLGTSYGGSSTASGGSTKPLLSFVAAANNINNASSVSADAEIESVTASDSSSSTPPNV